MPRRQMITVAAVAVLAIFVIAGVHTDPLWRSSLSIDARSVSATRWRGLLTTSPIPF